MDLVLVFANAFCALLVIILSLTLMVNDMRFQPGFAKTELGRILAWAARIGLALLIVSCGSYFLDIILQKGYSPFLLRECGVGLSIVLIFTRMVHKTFIQQHEYANAYFTSIARKTLGYDKPKKTYFGYGLGYLTAIGLTVGLLSFGPQLEERFLPVMDNIHYEHVERKSTVLVCWDFKYTKVRAAKPDYIIYLVRKSDGKQFDTTLYRHRGDYLEPFSVENRPNNLPAGNNYDIPVCADIPVSIWKEADLKLVGEIKYTTSFMWPFHQKLPALDIPPYSGK